MMYLMLLLVGSGILFLACSPKYGSFSQKNRIVMSENYHDGKFQNLRPISLNSGEGNMLEATFDFLKGNPNRVPQVNLPTDNTQLDESIDGEELRVAWLGHSTCLLQIDGKVILTDPMLSERASPVSFLGPKRFPYEPTVQLNDIKNIDAVLISHDHYDHLDYETIEQLKQKTKRFYVPLGVGGHLVRWGVAETQIVELDWWEQAHLGLITFVATPAQHFSGRGLTDRNKTLWASWVIQGAHQRVFFGGDSGYFAGFKEIGEKYGPFDITMLESGAYNDAWAEVHMMPEQTVQAHIDLKGKVLLPIHWAKFNLALHSWQEPIERLTKQAERDNVDVVTPRIGKVFTAGNGYRGSKWWKLAMK